MDTDPATPPTAVSQPSTAVAPPDPIPAPSGVGWLLRRWPVALGIALGAFQLATDYPHEISGLFVLLLAATGYVIVAAVGRPAWSWPIVGALVVVLFGARIAGTTEVVELVGLLVLATTAIVLGAVQGTWGRRDLYRWQPWAAVLFLGLAVLALALAPEVGRIVVAVALVGHGLWDVVHWRRHEVVSRSLAEWCAGLDLTLGIGVLPTPLWM
jgi:hypothetical protein